MEIYDLDLKAYKYYLSDVKNKKDNDFDTVRKRLTALLLNASETKNMGLGSIIYKIGNFNIVVKEGENKISWIYWSEKALPVTKEQQDKIKNIHLELGLNEDGNCFSDDEMII